MLLSNPLPLIPSPTIITWIILCKCFRNVVLQSDFIRAPHIEGGGGGGTKHGLSLQKHPLTHPHYIMTDVRNVILWFADTIFMFFDNTLLCLMLYSHVVSISSRLLALLVVYVVVLAFLGVSWHHNGMCR